MPQSPKLRRILVAYTVNELGTWFAYVALSIGVYAHTGSALAVAGMFVSARLVPALLVPAMVARVEASERRGRLTALYVLEAAAVAGLIYLLNHFSLAGVLVLVAVDGGAALTAAALLRASAARTAVEERAPPTYDSAIDGAGEQDAAQSTAIAQRQANAALNVAYTATVAIGPAVGGLVVAGAGITTALAIDIGSFLVCGLLLLDLATFVHEAGSTSVQARLRAAVAHLQAIPVLARLLTIEATALIFFASVEPIEVIYAKVTLGAGTRGFGLLIGAWGVGMVLGGLIFSRSLKKPLGPMLTVGTLMVGVSYLGSAAAPDLAIACAASIVGGTGNGVQWASLISAVQQLTPDALHGRLMSAVEAIGALCPAVGFMLGGLITALSTPRIAFLVAGVAATAATAVFYRMTTGADALSRPREPVAVPPPPAPESPALPSRLGG